MCVLAAEPFTTLPNRPPGGLDGGVTYCKCRSTASRVGRSSGLGFQQTSNNSHRPAVNHAPSSPRGFLGRSPSNIFLITRRVSTHEKNGVSPLRTSYIIIPSA